MMRHYQHKQIGREFKRFVRNQGYPKSLYQRNCAVDREDVCGGKGNTCAPDDAPEDFEQVLREFCEKKDYDYERFKDRAKEWIADLEEDVPSDVKPLSA